MMRLEMVSQSRKERDRELERKLAQKKILKRKIQNNRTRKYERKRQ